MGQNAGNPQVACSSDGTVISVVWERSNGTDLIIQSSTSSDFGTTWSPPIDLSASGQSASNPRVAIASEGGTIAAIWQRSDGSNTRIQFSGSNTSGATWSPPDNLSSGGQDAIEPHIVISSNGAILTAGWPRYDSINDIIQSSTSTDGGDTWSSPYDLSASGQNASDLHLAGSSDGTSADFVWLRSGIIQISHGVIEPEPTPTATPVCIHDGDVIDDDSLTAGDAQAAFEITMGLRVPSPEEFCRADCNGDESVTAGDAQIIFSATFGMGECVDPI